MELVEGAPLSGVCDSLSKAATSSDRIDAQSWRAALSTVVENARRDEKPLSTLTIAPHEGQCERAETPTRHASERTDVTGS